MPGYALHIKDDALTVIFKYERNFFKKNPETGIGVEIMTAIVDSTEEGLPPHLTDDSGSQPTSNGILFVSPL